MIPGTLLLPLFLLFSSRSSSWSWWAPPPRLRLETPSKYTHSHNSSVVAPLRTITSSPGRFCIVHHRWKYYYDFFVCGSLFFPHFTVTCLILKKAYRRGVNPWHFLWTEWSSWAMLRTHSVAFRNYTFFSSLYCLLHHVKLEVNLFYFVLEKNIVGSIKSVWIFFFVGWLRNLLNGITYLG